MTELQKLLVTVKSQLKARGLTYCDVAVAMELSEVIVKRLFSTDNLSLNRLVELCDLLDMRLAELTQAATASTPRLSRLDEKQEAELVSDPKLLLVATYALNHWRMADIVGRCRLDEAECLRCLLRLDRMRLSDLLPGNRIHINITRDFEWLPCGPIEQYFTSRGRDDSLTSNFDADDASVYFVHGMPTTEAHIKFITRLCKLRKRLASLHDESVHAAIGERQGTAILLALRDWEPPISPDCGDCQPRRTPLQHDRLFH
ncbi:MAG: transcriptional regulator [Gammaproteobacteria bacterium]|nr:transcriptional regulator [Gammaproteobacteria bacterium]